MKEIPTRGGVPSVKIRKVAQLQAEIDEHWEARARLENLADQAQHLLGEARSDLEERDAQLDRQHTALMLMDEEMQSLARLAWAVAHEGHRLRDAPTQPGPELERATDAPTDIWAAQPVVADVESIIAKARAMADQWSEAGGLGWSPQQEAADELRAVLDAHHPQPQAEPDDWDS